MGVFLSSMLLACWMGSRHVRWELSEYILQHACCSSRRLLAAIPSGGFRLLIQLDCSWPNPLESSGLPHNALCALKMLVALEKGGGGGLPQFKWSLIIAHEHAPCLGLFIPWIHLYWTPENIPGILSRCRHLTGFSARRLLMSML